MRHRYLTILYNMRGNAVETELSGNYKMHVATQSYYKVMIEKTATLGLNSIIITSGNDKYSIVTGVLPGVPKHTKKTKWIGGRCQA